MKTKISDVFDQKNSLGAIVPEVSISIGALLAVILIGTHLILTMAGMTAMEHAISSGARKAVVNGHGTQLDRVTKIKTEIKNRMRHAGFNLEAISIRVCPLQERECPPDAAGNPQVTCAPAERFCKNGDNPGTGNQLIWIGAHKRLQVVPALYAIDYNPEVIVRNESF